MFHIKSIHRTGPQTVSAVNTAIVADIGFSFSDADCLGWTRFHAMRAPDAFIDVNFYGMIFQYCLHQ
jgi:hypothetical protein